MLTYRFSPTKGDLELDYDGQQQAGTTTAAPTADKPAATGIKAGEKQNALNALTKAGLIQKAGEPGLTDLQLRTLLGMDALQNKDGDFELYKKGAKDPSIVVTKNGCVGINPDGSPGSVESINALVDGAIMFKTMHPNEGAYIYSRDEKTTAIMQYVSKKVGITVKNPSDKSLEELAAGDPAYAKIKEDIDKTLKEKIGNPPQPASTFSPAAAPAAGPNPDETQVTVGYKKEYSATGTIMGLSFDENTMAHSKLAQFLNGKDLSDVHDLGKEVDRLKKEGYEFTDHDRLLIKTLQSAIEPATNYPNYGPGVMGRDFSEDDLRVDSARKNWHSLEGISETIGNPPDPNADTVPHFSKSEILKDLGNREGIADSSRSGLTSPVQGGLSCKFDGCATGTDPSGDPARQKQLDTELEQKRPTPAPLGMSNTA